jgi:hypothetical protein
MILETMAIERRERSSAMTDQTIDPLQVVLNV